MRYAAALVAILLCLPSMAVGQETVSDVVNFLVTNQAVSTADFQRDRAAAEAARDTITAAIADSSIDLNNVMRNPPWSRHAVRVGAAHGLATAMLAVVRETCPGGCHEARSNVGDRRCRGKQK